MAKTGKPNILVIFGDDIGWFNASIYNMGMMGYRTPNIDRIGKEGIRFLQYTASSRALLGARRFSPVNTEFARA